MKMTESSNNTVELTRDGNDIVIRGDTSNFLKQCLKLGFNFALYLIIMKMMISTTLASATEMPFYNPEVRVNFSDGMWEQLQKAVCNMTSTSLGFGRNL